MSELDKAFTPSTAQTPTRHTRARLVGIALLGLVTIGIALGDARARSATPAAAAAPPRDHHLDVEVESLTGRRFADAR